MTKDCLPLDVKLDEYKSLDVTIRESLRHATKLHHTHACQACGMVWRPAIASTVGVRFLPGFKNT